jgi:endonuclease/exonuclease/phosphatase family metal-dependent hydrolase
MATVLCNFNANNLFVRYRFGKTFPGDQTKKSAVTNPDDGYLPMYDPDLFELFNPEQRRLMAQAIFQSGAVEPDIICFQEIESLIALRRFNEDHLESKYANALLVDSRDFRQIDVAILTKKKISVLNVRTHVDALDPKPDSKERPWLFSRDCFEVELGLPGGRRLTLFINHLKSKFMDTRNKTPEEQALERERISRHRGRQAKEVIRIVQRRFPGNAYNEELFAVVGDLNDEPGSKPLKALFNDCDLEDALARFPLEQDRWTHWWRGRNRVSQIDALLLSPALAMHTQGVAPVIERRGISFKNTLGDGLSGPKRTNFHRVEDDPSPVSVDFRFPRFADVTNDRYASDHCPVFFTIPS